MKKLLVSTALVVVGVGLSGYVKGPAPSEKLEIYGTVEAHNIRVGSRVAGRVQDVRVNEGDVVQPGQVLVTFSDGELQATVEQARAQVMQARATSRKLEQGYTPAEKAQAAAEGERAEAEAREAEHHFRRAEALEREGILSRAECDDARAKKEMANARWRQAIEHIAQTNSGYREEEINAGRAELMRAQAELRQAETRNLERQVVAPSAGVVEVLDVRPGDLVPANAPVVQLLQRNQLYVRAYVPETRVGLLSVGQPVQVQVDSFPNRVFAARVEKINQEPEFLPRNVQVYSDRVHEVIGVKLRVHDPDARLRPGMAARVTLNEGGS